MLDITSFLKGRAAQPAVSRERPTAPVPAPNARRTPTAGFGEDRAQFTAAPRSDVALPAGGTGDLLPLPERFERVTSALGRGDESAVDEGLERVGRWLGVRDKGAGPWHADQLRRLAIRADREGHSFVARHAFERAAAASGSRVEALRVAEAADRLGYRTAAERALKRAREF
jgi:hypothetical protein